MSTFVYYKMIFVYRAGVAVIVLDDIGWLDFKAKMKF
jgi:hypothetical protein